jgi:hypothetical protein
LRNAAAKANNILMEQIRERISENINYTLIVSLLRDLIQEKKVMLK